MNALLCLCLLAQQWSPIDAMAIEGQIRIQLDVYLADDMYAPLERVQIRRLQNDLMMIETKMTPEPYTERVERLMNDYVQLVRMDQILEGERRL